MGQIFLLGASLDTGSLFPPAASGGEESDPVTLPMRPADDEPGAEGVVSLQARRSMAARPSSRPERPGQTPGEPASRSAFQAGMAGSGEQTGDRGNVRRVDSPRNRGPAGESTRVGNPGATGKAGQRPADVSLLGITAREEPAWRCFDFDFSGPVRIEPVQRTARILRFRLRPGVTPVAPAVFAPLRAVFQNFTWHPGPAYVEIVARNQGGFGEPWIATSPSGLCRLVLPWRAEPAAFPLDGGEELAPGLTWHVDRPATKAGPTDVFILRFDPLTPGLNLFPVLANEGICQREVLTSMSRRYDALAGINAGFFNPARGDPIGTLIVNRRLVSSPLYNRAVFGLSDRNEPLFGHPDFSGGLVAGDMRVAIDSINAPRGANKLIVYTPEYSRSTHTSGDGLEWVLIKGRVIAIHKCDTLIPPDGVVLSATGEKAARLSRLRLGDRVDLDYRVTSPWDRIQHAVCGGPSLVSDGQVRITGQEERFDASIVAGRHPRTAVALTYGGDILMLVVDGRSRRSAGMTLSELARYLVRLGARQAMNLDGGGSAAMVVRGKVVNRPSDGKERPISNGLLITKN